MKLKAQRFVAGKLILKQALTAFQDQNKKKQAIKFFKLGGLVSGKVFTVLPRYPLDGSDKSTV